MNHFVAVTNERFCLGMIALIRSAMATNPDVRFTVVQLRNSKVSEHWLNAFRKLGADVLEIDGSPVERAIRKGARGGTGRYGPETYAKFLLEDYLDEPFWWLDTDMIVQREFDVPEPETEVLAIAPYFAAGIHQAFRNLHQEGVMDLFREHAPIDQVLAEGVALNGGVLWMSPSRIRKTDLKTVALELISVLHDHLTHADESIFNLIRPNYDFCILPDHVQRFVGYDVPYPYFSASAPLLHHYTGSLKPWMPDYPDEEAVSEYRLWLDVPY